MTHPRVLMFGLALLGLLLPCGAFAHEAEKKTDEFVLEAVTVTADKQKKDVQDLPASISVITDVQLEDFGITETSDIFERMPNLHLVEMGPKSMFTSMRGISGFMNGAPAVGFYVDDVYYPSFGLNLYDLERVEVLRGPQGTLYGRNTLGGVINVVTRPAGNEWPHQAGHGRSQLQHSGC